MKYRNLSARSEKGEGILLLLSPHLSARGGCWEVSIISASPCPCPDCFLFNISPNLRPLQSSQWSVRSQSVEVRPPWTLRELRASEHLWWHRNNGFLNRPRSVSVSASTVIGILFTFPVLTPASEHIRQGQDGSRSEEEGRRTEVNKRNHLRRSEKDQRRIQKEQ